jgi:CRP-like cAMP-binding protein
MRSVGWLSRQPEPFRAEVLARCKLCHFETGSLVHRTGQESECIYGLVDGVLELNFANGHVGTMVTPGYWIGEAEAFLGSQWHASVVAKTSIQMLCLPYSEFNQLILNPEYCRSFAQLTIEHLEEAFGIIAALMEHDPLARTRGRLIHLSRDQAHGEEPMRVTQSELASMCGLTRQTVAKVLRSLVEEGSVASKYGQLTVLDPAKLSGVQR